MMKGRASHPLICAAGVASLDIVEGEDVPAKARRIGAQMLERLQALMQRYDMIGDIRGRGQLTGIELVRDRQTKEPAPEAANQILERARDNGLLIGKGGLYGNVIRMAPPMNITKADVDEGIRLLDKSFEDIRR